MGEDEEEEDRLDDLPPALLPGDCVLDLVLDFALVAGDFALEADLDLVLLLRLTLLLLQLLLLLLLLLLCLLVGFEDVDRDLVCRLVWVRRDRDLGRCLCHVCLVDLFLGVAVGLESFLPYRRRFLGHSVSPVVVGDALGDLWDAVSVVVGPVLLSDNCRSCPCPGDSGGVELVTGANTVSLLIMTSQCPVALNLGASSANST